jgi:hypothetical protein
MYLNDMISNMEELREEQEAKLKKVVATLIRMGYK